MARHSMIESSPYRKEVDAALDGTEDVAKIAERFGFSLSAVYRYKVAREKKALLYGVGRVEVAEKYTPPAVSEKSGSDVDQANAHVTWQKERLAAAIAKGAKEADITAIAAQYQAALKYRATLAGAFNVTEATLVRHAAWVRLEALIVAALKKHPAALKDVLAAVAELSGEGHEGG